MPTGTTDLKYLSTDGNVYPNYPLAPDFQGCGYSDPDHSWEGWLIEYNFGKMDGFLQRPTALDLNPGVTAAAVNTFPIGFYTNLDPDGTPKAVPDLPVLGALAQNYTVLDHYFCSFAGETFPNRFYQHAARTDRDHNITTTSTLPTIWDQLSPIPNNKGIPTGGYFFRDLPFLALWGLKYYPFWHLFAPGDTDVLGIPVTTLSFLDTVAQGLLPMSASSTPSSPSPTTEPGPMTIPRRTSGAVNGLSRTPTTPSPTLATWTAPCSSSPSMSGAASTITSGPSG